MPPRPGQYPQRPGMPPRPMYQQRPGGTGRPAAAQRREHARPAPPQAAAAPPPVTKTITLAEGMTVKDLADKLDLRVKDVLAKLLMKRLMLTINSALDTETATMIAREFGADVLMQSFEDELLQADEGESRAEDQVMRAPVVTARRACSTPSARPASPNARRAGSRSTSARITSRSTVATSCSSIPRATPHSR
jgi:translation initiation factor IF-2